MTTTYQDPASDDAVAWANAEPAGTHYTTVDDGTRQPDTPDDSDYVSSGTNGQSDDYTLTAGALSDGDSVTEMKVWIYGKGYNAPPMSDISVDLYIDGAWQGAVELDVGTAAGWHSNAFSGSWTGADAKAAKIRITSVVPGGIAVNYCYAAYVEVTYTATGGRSRMEMMGIGFA